MSSVVHFMEVVESIAALPFKVPASDANHISSDALLSTPLIEPRPDEFITDVKFSRESLHTGGQMNLEYVVHWRYLHAPIGSNLGLFSVYGATIQGFADLLGVIADVVVVDGAVDVVLENVDRVAVLKDAVGNDYHGVEFGLRVKEFINL